VWRLFQRHAPECLGGIKSPRTLEPIFAAH